MKNHNWDLVPKPSNTNVNLTLGSFITNTIYMGHLSAIR